MKTKTPNESRYELNEDGIILQEIYMLNYYGVYVFFRVCGTKKNSVYLIELATKKTKWGIMLTKDLHPSKNPLVVRKDNVFTKSTYEVTPVYYQGKLVLPIAVNYCDPLWMEAKKHADYPIWGTAYAVRVKKYLNVYWKDPTAEKDKKGQKKKKAVVHKA